MPDQDDVLGPNEDSDLGPNIIVPFPRPPTPPYSEGWSSRTGSSESEGWSSGGGSEQENWWERENGQNHNKFWGGGNLLFQNSPDARIIQQLNIYTINIQRN